MAAPGEGARWNIGDVLELVRPDFPDITISKIRFLEAEGLVEPERTASGYRKFSAVDVERLRYVLSLQRDHYLPLKVIRDHLDALDRGLTPTVPSGGGGPGVVARAAPVPAGLPSAADLAPSSGTLRLSRAELAQAGGVDADELGQLESFGLLAPDPSGHYDGDALLLVRTVAELASHGIGPRHLRPFTLAADREAGLIAQVVAPLLRQRAAGARAKADETARELAALSLRLHTVLVRRAVADELERAGGSRE